jgi:hypothetical protein
MASGFWRARSVPRAPPEPPCHLTPKGGAGCGLQFTARSLSLKLVLVRLEPVQHQSLHVVHGHECMANPAPFCCRHGPRASLSPPTAWPCTHLPRCRVAVAAANSVASPAIFLTRLLLFALYCHLSSTPRGVPCMVVCSSSRRPPAQRPQTGIVHPLGVPELTQRPARARPSLAPGRPFRVLLVPGVCVCVCLCYLWSLGTKNPST